MEKPGGSDRPTGDEMLERVRRQAGAGAKGRLRVYLGMAPGVGKTFAMLNEGRRRKARGTDVVIGFVETYGRPLTAEAIGDLEVIPRRKIPYRGVTLEELDTEAVLRRNPDIALVDELAHTNAPGSQHEKRWQDVMDLLGAGVTVISTVNIQHVESLGDIVESITGITVRERIPDKILDEADEIELVDITPHALQQRLRHGNVYPKERAEQALREFFREGNLNALRELSLRKVSTAVEQDLEAYMRGHDVGTVWPAAEKVMVAVTGSQASGHRLRRGWRDATRGRTALIAVFVETPAWSRATPERKRELEQNLRLATDLGAEIIRVKEPDVARALAHLARENNVGTLIVGHRSQGLRRRLFRRSVTNDLLELLDPEIDLRVVRAAEGPAEPLA